MLRQQCNGIANSARVSTVRNDKTFDMIYKIRGECCSAQFDGMDEILAVIKVCRGIATRKKQRERWNVGADGGRLKQTVGSKWLQVTNPFGHHNRISLLPRGSNGKPLKYWFVREFQCEVLNKFLYSNQTVCRKEEERVCNSAVYLASTASWKEWRLTIRSLIRQENRSIKIEYARLECALPSSERNVKMREQLWRPTSSRSRQHQPFTVRQCSMLTRQPVTYNTAFDAVTLEFAHHASICFLCCSERERRIRIIIVIQLESSITWTKC